MLTLTSKQGRLVLAAEAAGLRQTKQGQFGVGKKKADWAIEIGQTGWLTVSRRWNHQTEDLLTTHATWRGPVKLEKTDGKVIQRLEVPLGQLLSDELCMTRDDDEQARVDQLLVNILKNVPMWLSGTDEIANWSPPSAESVSEWLVAAGHECAIDNEGHLRFALTRRGCDGQIRIERAEDRLRFVMPLGEWNDLKETARQSIHDLANEANSRSRLVRIALIAGEGDSVRCEAQVDLSGLPYAEPLEEAGKTMWGEMIRATVDSLELALRRLGLELNSIAEPNNHELADIYAMGW